MTINEILALDTSSMSLTEMVNLLTETNDWYNDVYRLRVRHEEDTDIPMEEDEIGEGWQRLVEMKFPNIIRRIHELEKEQCDEQADD